MEHLKNHNKSGFMLMEVLLTIALVGMALAPAYMMEGTIQRSLSRYSARIRLLYHIKNFWTEVVWKIADEKETERTDKRQVSNPSATLTYRLSPVGENSSLKKIKGMHKVQVTGKSTRNARESIVGFVYKPEREKK